MVCVDGARWKSTKMGLCGVSLKGGLADLLGGQVDGSGFGLDGLDHEDCLGKV
jgi:hypothetical protein